MTLMLAKNIKGKHFDSQSTSPNLTWFFSNAFSGNASGKYPFCRAQKKVESQNTP
jgi:hypothetical protein